MTKSTTSLTVLAAALALTLGIASHAGPAHGGYQAAETGFTVVLEAQDTKDEKQGESCNHD